MLIYIHPSLPSSWFTIISYLAINFLLMKSIRFLNEFFLLILFCLFVCFVLICFQSLLPLALLNDLRMEFYSEIIWNSDFKYCHFPYCSVSFITLASVVYITQILPKTSHLISVSLNLLYLCSDCPYSRYLQCSCSHSSSLFRDTFPERSTLTTLLMSPLNWLVCYYT